MYKLSDGTNDLIFSIAMNFNYTRTLNEMELPYVADIWLTDQITTRREFNPEGIIKTGTGRPYATVKDALAAIEAIFGDTYCTGMTLRGGDWNGSTWSANSNYPFELGVTGTRKILAASINGNWARGEPTNGQLTFNLNLKLGQVF